LITASLHQQQTPGNLELIQGIDWFHAHISLSQRGMFRLLQQADRVGVWQDSGAKDMAHWVAMRQGISEWKARRWIACAYALDSLPVISEAFSAGELSIDKVVELTRFATRETEQRLVLWAQQVSSGAIRRRADREVRQSIQDDQEAENARYCNWWYFDEDRRFGLQAELPAAQGAVVAKALERLGKEVPTMPGEEGPWHEDARRADALVALASSRIAQDQDPDRATVVVHAPLEALVSGPRWGRARERTGDPPGDRKKAPMQRQGPNRYRTGRWGAS
jgi:hypothetical protein